MARRTNYVRPVRLAMEALKEAGINSFPVPLSTVLRHYGITLMSYEYLCKKSGYTLEMCYQQFGNDGAISKEFKNGRVKLLIVYNHAQSSMDRLRFTFAHELGHLILGHLDEAGVSLLQRKTVEKELYDVQEDEANCFARNLLCPAVAVQTVLRSQGFTSSSYDEKQERVIWKKLDHTPDLPRNLSDFFLIRQAFMVSDTAAKTRCHFLREDLRYSAMADASDFFSTFTFTVQWRCMDCGAQRLPGTKYCYNCGSEAHYRFISGDSPAPPPVLIEHPGTTSCPVCGNSVHPEANYCTNCGALLYNVCKAGHRNPRYAKYCVICGNPAILAPSEGTPSVPPSITDAYETNSIHQLVKCRYCGHDRHDSDARHCTMCGRPIVNYCTKCKHINAVDARYCKDCGSPTVFQSSDLFSITEYSDPPSPPEGHFTRQKRFKEEFRAWKKEINEMRKERMSEKR